jgi:hypothetical protein
MGMAFQNVGSTNPYGGGLDRIKAGQRKPASTARVPSLSPTPTLSGHHDVSYSALPHLPCHNELKPVKPPELFM